MQFFALAIRMDVCLTYWCIRSVDRAVKLYHQSIGFSDEGGFIHDQALACERAYSVLQQHGRATQAKPFLQRAIELYTKWGAMEKVKLLRPLIQP